MKKVLNLLKNTFLKFKKLFSWQTVKDTKALVTRFLSFVILLISYLVMRTVISFSNSRFAPKFLTKLVIPPVSKAYEAIVNLNRHAENTINRVNLIELSLRNMKFKATRTLITVGGMSVGIAAIVFLVSLGFGLQELVTSRVARLDELKQADVATQPGSNIKIDDASISNIGGIKEVKHALPLIAIVGKVNFSGSVADMAVYGVTTEYLNQSAIKPVRGNVFDSNELTLKLPEEEQTAVAGASVQYTNSKIGDVVGNIEFSIPPNKWLIVRESPKSDAKIIGFTRRVEGQQSGKEVWGGSYTSLDNRGKAAKNNQSEWLGKWIQTKVYLWDRNGRKYEKLETETGQQIQELGYITEASLEIIDTDVIEPEVLGLISEAYAQEASEATAGLMQNEDGEWVYIEEELNLAPEQQVKKVQLPTAAKKEAVVNRAMLKVLGIEEVDALGQTFEVSFIATSAIQGEEEKIESEPAQYKIVAVIPPEEQPFFYVPFLDLRSLGIANYSQLKTVVAQTDDLQEVRQKIEALGYITTSVVDTVEQINRLFGTARVILALIGTVALAVASLGMFNTLTVSLLERTREIGLMKAMGMKSHEVQELFLTESMIMGIFGGLLGVTMGFIAGKAVGLLLSIFAISKGVGYIDISYVPPALVLLVLFLSMIVGIVTGIYPARRATKISALNALRYE